MVNIFINDPYNLEFEITIKVNEEIELLFDMNYVERNGKYKIWWQHGKLHRLDGPAEVWPNGHKEWYQNGKLHRLDGPAIMWSDGTESYYIEGEQLLRREFMERTNAKPCFTK